LYAITCIILLAPSTAAVLGGKYLHEIDPTFVDKSKVRKHVKKAKESAHPAGLGWGGKYTILSLFLSTHLRLSKGYLFFKFNISHGQLMIASSTR
jgi:hypothetical protein